MPDDEADGVDGGKADGGRRQRYAVDARLAMALQVGDNPSLHIHPPPRPAVVWPRRVGVVPPRADCFQQRDLGAESVGSGGTLALTRVLSGLGGVGKTQLAVAYAERCWADRQVDLLVWITAGSREAIVSGYATAAAEIGEAVNNGERDMERAAQRFVAWLAETSRRWLIVLDDVQDPSDLRGLWPPQHPTGRVVVTTRRRDAALSGHGRRLVEVGLFTSTEAITYLEAKLAHRPGLAVGAAELAADLAYLPLALAQAATYLADRNLSCADYRHRLADRRKELADLLPEPSGLPDDNRSTVAATWSLSIELANQLGPAGLARPILELASVLDPNGIPREVFATRAVLTHLADGAARTVDADAARDALHCLHRLSLANVDPDSPHRCVRVHSLVQRATRDQVPDARLALVAHAAADALLEMWPTIERDPDLGEALRANTDVLHTHTQAQLWQSAAHPVLFRVGASRGDVGLVAAAASYFQDLHTTAAQRLGPDHPDTLAARHNLARWRAAAGDLAGATIAFDQLLADQLRVLGHDHPDTLTTRSSLAHWRGAAGDPTAAAAAFDQLLADRLRVLGPDHPDTLTTRSYLAYWQGEAGDPAGAATAFDQLLVDQLRILGPDHPRTLNTRHNLAGQRGAAGDPAEAAIAFDQLLADQLRVLGLDHPQTLNTRHNLAVWRGVAGDPAGATALLDQLHADCLRVLGPDHLQTLTTRHNLAYWRSAAGDPAGAAAALERDQPDSGIVPNSRGEE